MVINCPIYLLGQASCKATQDKVQLEAVTPFDGGSYDDRIDAG